MFLTYCLLALIVGFVLGTYYGPQLRMRLVRRVKPADNNVALRNYQAWKASKR